MEPRPSMGYSTAPVFLEGRSVVRCQCDELKANPNKIHNSCIYFTHGIPCFGFQIEYCTFDQKLYSLMIGLCFSTIMWISLFLDPQNSIHVVPSQSCFLIYNPTSCRSDLLPTSKKNSRRTISVESRRIASNSYSL